MERTFVMVKPDGVQRGLVGEVVKRFETRGLKMVGMKLLQIDLELAERHYGIHKARPFYGELIEFITSGPSVAMVWEGRNAIQVARKIIGATNPVDAEAGSIRGDLAIFTGQNIVHGSDAPETAAEEIANFFGENELVSFDLALGRWIG